MESYINNTCCSVLPENKVEGANKINYQLHKTINNLKGEFYNSEGWTLAPGQRASKQSLNST